MNYFYMFNLVTTYYDTRNPNRQKEIDLCLEKNLENEHIEKIYLLNDKNYDLFFLPCEKKEKKIVQIVVNDQNKNRLHFDYAISFINNNLHGQKCILSNSDIYFDDTLKKLINYDLTNVFCALLRHDNNILDVTKVGCQDSWIFVSPLNINLEQCKFRFGCPGCDNKIAWIAKNANYKVINPAKTIVSHHVHSSGIRNYTNSDLIHPPYHLIPCSTLEN